ncbi:tRNA 2-thiouridine(34) synthase MnmA [bacterium]|nr:tRNA 2-thiouridine(34) synthase MnmA [bacterium]
MKKRVAVMLSGGVDSSVSAFLLLKEGYEVIGLTAKLLNQDNYTPQINAKAVADFLNIEHYTLDLTKEFEEEVIKYFLHSYETGDTPNPCCKCNRKIKWGKLLDYAVNELHCDFIATGHYATIKEEGGRYKLYPAKDIKKDQLYFLYGLSQEQLSRTIFPLSGLTKEEVKEIAKNNELPTKSAKESQDICFIQRPMTTGEFISDHFEEKQGDIRLYPSNKKVGEHSGFYRFTLGQRKGLNVAYTEPLYVREIDTETNTVYLAPKSETMINEINISNINFFETPKETTFRAKVKIRYNMPLREADITLNGDSAKITLDEPALIQSKGQIAVVYDLIDGHIILGGTIFG